MFSSSHFCRTKTTSCPGVEILCLCRQEARRDPFYLAMYRRYQAAQLLRLSSLYFWVCLLIISILKKKKKHKKLAFGFDYLFFELISSLFFSNLISKND
jgi:hypothetical protein